MDSLPIKKFLDLETAVWEALKTGNAAADAALLADSFLGVYASGFANKSDHSEQLDDGPTIAEYSISEAKLMVLAGNIVLLSYLAAFRRPRNPTSEQMYVSSIWQKINGKWLGVFSQDTAVGEMV